LCFLWQNRLNHRALQVVSALGICAIQALIHVQSHKRGSLEMSESKPEPKPETKPEPRKLFIKTYGCQMNVYDSERMAEALEGYDQVQTPDEADMTLLNTCHLREKAAEKVYSELGRFKGLRAEKPDLKIGVAGCVAQAEGEEIMRRQPMVDLVVGPQSYHRLPELEAKARSGAKALDTDMPEEDKFEHLKARPKAQRGPTAFLTVQEGCDKFCAFCVVPYTRGAEVSRPVDRVLSEARDLVERGVREITLLGQNVNAYHGADGSETRSLAWLIRRLARLEGLARIRYTTSHPNDFTDDLVAARARSTPISRRKTSSTTCPRASAPAAARPLS